LEGSSAQWRGLGRRLGAEPLTAETLIWALVDAGLAEVEERRDRRGDWRPLRCRLTPLGKERAPAPCDVEDSLQREVADWLRRWETATADHRAHPVLCSIAHWLVEAMPGARPRAVRTVLATAQRLAIGEVPIERALSLIVFGNTKSLRVEEFRDELTVAFGRPMDDVIRRHASAALVYGDFAFTIHGTRMRADWSLPWLALTEQSLANMQDLTLASDTLVTIENLTCFESFVNEGPPGAASVLWTGGFLGGTEARFLTVMRDAGLRRIRHWGDLDPDGLAIMAHLGSVTGLPVEPFRMAPELLDRLPGRPLTERDRGLLIQWIAQDKPWRGLAEAILARGVKVEQEAWYAGGM